MNWNAKDTSEIAINRIFVEHVDKEKKNPNTKTIYTANPSSSIPMNNGLGSRIPFVTDKVGLSTVGEPIEIGDDVQVQAVVKGLIDAYKTPAEKLSDPETMAQEVGWFHKPLVSRNPRFVHGIKQGECTEFAEIYTKKMAGEHMFHGKTGKYLTF